MGKEVFKREMVDELMKCKDDPIYFGDTYYNQIRIADGMKVFPLYETQKEVVRAIQENQVLVGAVARQTGISMVAGMYALWDAMFHADKTIVIVSPKMESGSVMLTRMKTAFEELPDWMKAEVKQWNKREVVFANNSRIMIGYSESSFCGMTCDTLFLADAGYYKKDRLKDIVDSIFPIVLSRRTSKVFIWSTPNGKNYFHTLYKNAGKKHKAGYQYWKQICVKWNDIPHRGAKWKKGMIEAFGSKEVFKREMECVF